MYPISLPLLGSRPPNISFLAFNSDSRLRPATGPRFLPARCGSRAGEEPPPDWAGKVEELLRREENRGLLDGLEEASRRVDRARDALADIQRQEAEMLRAKQQLLQLRSRESQIAASQNELFEARSMVEEAQSSLSSSIDEKNFKGAQDEENQDSERWESIKAALFSSLIGTLAALPISFYQATSSPQLSFHLITIFISCALFGVTFRYTIRRDLDNTQLKTGISGAFGFVKGLATLDAGKPFEANFTSLISHSVDGALYVSENIFIFLFSAIALDFCFKSGFLSPFPIRK